jgi:acyl-CoA synthetase (NDP forming)
VNKLRTENVYRDVEPLLRPRSITIVGASERSGSWSERIYYNLRSYGYPGEIHLVNPRHRELYGAPCFPSVSQVVGDVDQMVVIVPARHVPATIEEGGARGFRSAVVFSGGFSETGTPDGIEAEREMVAAADQSNMGICGPNCLGNISTRERVITLAEYGVEFFKEGGLALVSQSSGLMGGIVRYAHSRTIGLSYAIASGSEANLDAADYLNYLVGDDSTRVVGLVLEAIRRPAAFASACERARAARKPLLVLKIGRSKGGQGAALSHTGALAGSYEAFKAFCRRYGLIEVRGFDEMVDAAEIFVRSPLPTAVGVAALSLSGGGRGYIHDLGEDLGITFPILGSKVQAELEKLIGVGAGVGNPLDLGAAGASDPATQFSCFELLAGEPEIGLVALQGDLPREPGSAGRAEGLKRIVEHAQKIGKPVVFFSRASQPVTEYAARFRDSCRAPFLQEIGKSFQAIAHVMAYRNALQGDIEEQPSQPPVFWAGALSAGLCLPDHEAFALLKQEGLTVARYEICTSLKAAERAGEVIGYPLALKTSAPGVTHKSEMGGVILGVRTPEELTRGFLSLEERGVRAGINEKAILVQEMVDSPLELFAAGRTDPEFGPLVLFGFGGLFVEALGHHATRLAPVDLSEAQAMLAESGVDKALRRLRLAEPFLRAPILDAIVGMSRLIAAHKEIDTIEINPLLFRRAGHSCVAVDVVALRGSWSCQGSKGVEASEKYSPKGG